MYHEAQERAKSSVFFVDFQTNKLVTMPTLILSDHNKAVHQGVLQALWIRMLWQFGKEDECFFSLLFI